MRSRRTPMAPGNGSAARALVHSPPCAGTSTTRWPVGPSSAIFAQWRSITAPRRLRRPPGAAAGQPPCVGEKASPTSPARCARVTRAGLRLRLLRLRRRPRAKPTAAASRTRRRARAARRHPRGVHPLRRRGLPRLRLEPPAAPRAARAPSRPARRRRPPATGRCTAGSHPVDPPGGGGAGARPRSGATAAAVPPGAVGALDGGGQRDGRFPGSASRTRTTAPMSRRSKGRSHPRS